MVFSRTLTVIVGAKLNKGKHQCNKIKAYFVNVMKSICIFVCIHMYIYICTFYSSSFVCKIFTFVFIPGIFFFFTSLSSSTSPSFSKCSLHSPPPPLHPLLTPSNPPQPPPPEDVKASRLPSSSAVYLPLVHLGM